MRTISFMRLTGSARTTGYLQFAALATLVIGAPTGVYARSQDASQQSSSQDSSVADAARRNREKKDKKKDSTTPSKSAKVITDDDLDRRPFKPGQEGLNVGSSPKMETEAPSSQAVASEQAADKASDQKASRDAAGQDAEIAKVKAQIADAEKDLDLTQRLFALDQDSYLSNPDHSRDAAGKTKLDGEKQQIDSKQQEVDRLKAKLAELESHRKSAPTQTAPPQTENAPSTPPQS